MECKETKKDNPYFSHYRELIEFNHETPISALLSPKNNYFSIRLPNSSKFLLAAASFSKSLSQTDSKLALEKGKQNKLAAKIRDWSESLWDELEDCRFNRKKLKQLKKTANKIFQNQCIIEYKLRELNIENENLYESLQILNKRIKSILWTPKIQQESGIQEEGLFSLISRQNLIQRGVSTSCPNNSILTIPNFGRGWLQNARSGIYQNEKERLKEEIHKQELSIHFSPDNIKIYPETWQKHLIEEFKKLEGYETISTAALLVKDVQALEILRNSIKNPSLRFNMVYFIVSLPYETLAVALQGMENEEIAFINQILLKSSEISKYAFQCLFRKQRQMLVEVCNAKGGAIDVLDKRFRVEIEPNAIRREDIKDILDLLQDIKEHLVVFKQYQLLFAKVVNDSESQRLIFGEDAEIEAEYTLQIKRLSDDDKEILKVRGCPFGIIHRRVFVDNLVIEAVDKDYFMDDEEAFEILGAWSIISLAEWRELGLLGEIDEQTFQELSKKSSAGFCLGRERLAKMGIWTIKDLKNRHIYNASLLKQFIQEYAEIHKDS